MKLREIILNEEEIHNKWYNITADMSDIVMPPFGGGSNFAGLLFHFRD